MKGMLVLAAIAGALASGCGGDAHLELAAADALHVVADELDVSLDEYHAELAGLDDAREAEVIHAFVDRVRRDHADEAVMAGHEEAFTQAMERIREDRATSWRRHQGSADNVATVREVATGLQKLALQSLSLEDEMRRYLESWIELRRSRQDTPATRTSP
jgi:hypothetical protein